MIIVYRKTIGAKNILRADLKYTGVYSIFHIGDY